MGAAAAAHADLVLVTDDNPRSEDPANIRAAIVRGALAQDRSASSSSDRIREIGNRAAAIRAAVALAGAGDTVVVLGKGHESGQEIAGVVHPFDDRAELRAALIEQYEFKEHTVGQESGQESGHAAADVTRGVAQ
jgi:UDP-N-acetylmuramoyl-L-alanyl-D-glutamate--2,6-diaminopimelate ligase